MLHVFSYSKLNSSYTCSLECDTADNNKNVETRKSVLQNAIADCRFEKSLIMRFVNQQSMSSSMDRSMVRLLLITELVILEPCCSASLFLLLPFHVLILVKRINRNSNSAQHKCDTEHTHGKQMRRISLHANQRTKRKH